MNLPMHPIRPAGRAEGFSLPELLAVMVIIAILASLSFPRIDAWMTNMRVSGLRTEVQAELANARMEAVRSGSSVRFEIAADGRSYRVFRTPATASSDTFKRFFLGDSYVGATLAPASGAIVFNSRGMATTSGSVRIVKGTRADTVTVSAIGRIR
jgi:prepilin-type N-terminal cleavage/methylation domain-containing protein